VRSLVFSIIAGLLLVGCQPETPVSKTPAPETAPAQISAPSKSVGAGSKSPTYEQLSKIPKNETDMAKKLGLPMYPGIKLGGAGAKAPIVDENGDLRVDMVLVSADSAKVVSAWYAKKLKLEASETKGEYSLMGKVGEAFLIIGVTKADSGPGSRVKVKGITKL